MTVLVVGGLNVDVVYDVDRTPEAHEKLRAQHCTVSGGGSGANTAHWLARLAVPVKMIAAAGDDLFGQYALKELAHAGVDITQCEIVPNYATGIAAIFSHGLQKCMITGGSVLNRNAQTSLLSRLDEQLKREPAHVHVVFRDREILSALLDILDRHRVTISHELNGSYDEGIASRFRFIFSNVDELNRAMGSSDAAKELAIRHKSTPMTAFLTAGERGAMVIERGDIQWVPTEPLVPLDRTGGGDAFNAGAIYSLLRGESPRVAALTGLKLARLVLMGWGPRPKSVNVEDVLV